MDNVSRPFWAMTRCEGWFCFRRQEKRYYILFIA
jgi:hypothetical protein